MTQLHHAQAENDEIDHRVADQDGPKKIFRIFQEAVQDRRPPVAAAHALADAESVQGQHARFHARKQKGKRDAQQRRQQDQNVAVMAHRFLTTSTSNSRMRRSSAACTVRRKPPIVTDSPGGGHHFQLLQRQPGHGFARRARPGSGGYSRRKLSRRNAPPTRQRVRPSFSRTGAFGGVLAANFAQHFRQNVFDGDNAGGAAEFIQHDGQAALLALQALQQLQQIHALRHEGRKLDGQGQVRLRIQQQTLAC